MIHGEIDPSTNSMATYDSIAIYNEDRLRVGLSSYHGAPLSPSLSSHLPPLRARVPTIESFTRARPFHVVFISTYPPHVCGIATFTRSLHKSIEAYLEK